VLAVFPSQAPLSEVPEEGRTEATDLVCEARSRILPAETEAMRKQSTETTEFDFMTSRKRSQGFGTTNKK
jgi:hypothetical protein